MNERIERCPLCGSELHMSENIRPPRLVCVRRDCDGQVFPFNEVNVRHLGEAVAAMKLSMSAGAARLGERVAKVMQDISDGIDNATRP